MPEVDHVLERRAHLLAGRLSGRLTTLKTAVAPPGQRPPFTTQMSQREALTWWREHFDDDLGKKVRERMNPESQMELQLALSQANEAEMMEGLI